MSLSPKSQFEVAPKGTRRSLSVSDAVYLIATLAAAAIWLFPLNAPLWLDETISYWQIAGGFSQLWARQGNLSPLYPFLLWLSTKLLGTSVIALRLPSVVAAIAATWIFYRVARRLYSVDAARMATAVFVLYPTFIFAAIDARPYAFAVLSINLAAFFLLRWMDDTSPLLAGAFGAACGLVLHLQYLFAPVLIGLGALAWMIHRKHPARFRTWWIAIVTFGAATAPMALNVVQLFRSRSAHVFSEKPGLKDLLHAVAPNYMLVLGAATLVIAVVTRNIEPRPSQSAAANFLPLLISVPPLLMLFAVSSLTPVHIFVGRYYLSAVPGLALLWAWFGDRIRSTHILQALTVLIVATAFGLHWHNAREQGHGYSWAPALRFADVEATRSNATMLICSDLPESDFAPLPFPAESWYLAQLTYYPVHAPVIGLPRSLTPAAKRQIQSFTEEAIARRQTFLVLAFKPSWPTIDYIAHQLGTSFVRVPVATEDGVAVTEFHPR